MEHLSLNHPPMKFFRPLIKNKYIKSKNESSTNELPTLKDCMYRIDNLEKELKLIKLIIQCDP
jgi:hypothetical protein